MYFVYMCKKKRETRIEQRRNRRNWKENVDWSSDDCFSLLSVFFCRCNSNQLILYEDKKKRKRNIQREREKNERERENEGEKENKPIRCILSSFNKAINVRRFSFSFLFSFYYSFVYMCIFNKTPIFHHKHYN